MARRGAGRTLAGAVVAAATTSTVRAAFAVRAPGGAERWTRTNHRGEPISLLEGPAVAAGLVAGAVAGAPDARAAVATAIATGGAGAFGLVDDLAEDTSTRTKGLRGHLGALAHGRLTTGGLKVLGIGATSLVAAAVAAPRRERAATSGVVRVADVVLDGALVAASANLVNLLDLRPGRALKATGLAALPGLGSTQTGISGAVLGAGAAAVRDDLGEKDMLGDGGANALGALLGTQAVLAAPRPVRLALLAGVVGLTVASERVSFSVVIDRQPVLRALDTWGRRPAGTRG
ncbi:hypothetical protein CLV28_1931 [Sediminihabitans luteus]|uniref:UDP-N-acetylmuramyl pentapeptide phosphotransferase/UDP-N-acetylglucosamine-1-phosphate transferase n=1 Tax=Sediminihabitans luteus TaxID=1138585 RepID=A0A2M9CRA0_9CELL|nr:hypothetical protein [Sediminihabitans luteus]PJJ74434.1 hypothetical protein CLV28_1931 [Sediminihabitans luteus]GIJ00199.1 hypothetical protein Slu03_25760 [Sediminihabitans luteus]